MTCSKLTAAETQRDVGNLKEALHLFQEVAEENPLLIDPLLEIAKIHVELKEISLAQAELLRTLEKFPESAEAHRLLAHIYFELGEWEKALNHLELFSAQDSYASEQLPQRGICYLKLGNYSKAAQIFQLGTQKNPQDFYFYHHLGDSYFLLGKIEDACNAYVEALQRNPHYAWSHFNLGRCQLALGNMLDAVRNIRAALVLDQNLPEGALYLADALARLSEIGKASGQEAISYYQQALRQTPDNTEIVKRIDQIRNHHTPSEKGSSADHLSLARYSGYVDVLGPLSVSGWVQDLQDLTAAVEIDVFINNRFFTTCKANIFREDLKIKNRKGHYGFDVRLPLFSELESNVDIRVQVHGTTIVLPAVSNQITVGPVGTRHHELSALRFREQPLIPSSRLYTQQQGTHFTTPQSHPEITIIVLNLDGAKLLESLFSSFYKFNSYPNFRFLVVDHSSQDDSLRVSSHWSQQLPIEIHVRPKNYSFSSSNNFAVQKSNAPFLFFLNNDISFNQDILPRMIQYFQDSSIGLVAPKLLEPSSPKTYSPPAPNHLGVQFFEGSPEVSFRPFELPFGPASEAYVNCPAFVPALTGAALMCRRLDFLSLGGFDEQYNYGYEDIDLCLRMNRVLGKSSVSAGDLSAIHKAGSTRSQLETSSFLESISNAQHFSNSHEYFIRRNIEEEILRGDAFWRSHPTRVGFAISSLDPARACGDLFSAFELGEQFSHEFGWSVSYLSADSEDQYDAAALDILIVMLHDYDIRKLKHVKPELRVFAWMRNWFDVWSKQPWIEQFDGLWSSSSISIQESFSQTVYPLPLATQWERFSQGTVHEEYLSDYCFTGSWWGHTRDIEQYLFPNALPFKFRLFGANWEHCERLKPYANGVIHYSELPHVYASTKIVIDDANHVTAKWASVNSRVFDALAAGALVLTNGTLGSSALFQGKLPTFHSRESLEELLNYYLTNDNERKKLVQELQAEVLQKHTYQQRAREVNSHIRHRLESSLRISIKIATPSEAEAKYWGDYHFAVGLRKALMKLGHRVRIDFLSQWYDDIRQGDHVSITLRGLSRYVPHPGQINLLWNISHPDKVDREEYNSYDAVFVASLAYAKLLAAQLQVPTYPLLQCTDPDLFFPEYSEDLRVPDLVFIGNSRRELRKIVGDTLLLGAPFGVYGREWKDLIPANILLGEHIPNDELHLYYRKAKIVLNDHWESMRQNGFLSNRLFDAAASGALILSDKIDCLAEIFGAQVLTYETPEELSKQIQTALGYSEATRATFEHLGEQIRRNHSFDTRAQTILSIIEQIHKAKTLNACGSENIANEKVQTLPYRQQRAKA